LSDYKQRAESLFIAVESTLAQPDDRAALHGLEALQRSSRGDPLLGQLLWLFGPPLYARDRLLFTPFLRAVGASTAVDRSGARFDPWTGRQGAAARAWAAALAADGEVELYRRVYETGYHRRRYKRREHTWREDLLALVGGAAPGGRRDALAMLRGYGRLDQDTALKLLALCPPGDTAASDFVLNHLPHGEAPAPGRRRSARCVRLGMRVPPTASSGGPPRGGSGGARRRRCSRARASPTTPSARRSQPSTPRRSPTTPARSSRRSSSGAGAAGCPMSCRTCGRSTVTGTARSPRASTRWTARRASRWWR